MIKWILAPFFLLMPVLSAQSAQELIWQWTLQFESISRPSIAMDGFRNVNILGGLLGQCPNNRCSQVWHYPADMYIMKFNAQDTQLWTEQEGRAMYGNTGLTPVDLALDGSNNAYVAGLYPPSHDYTLIMKFGANRQKQWAQQLGNNSHPLEVFALVVDTIGNCYVCGRAVFTEQQATAGNNVNGQTPSIFVTKYSAQGTTLWMKQRVSSTMSGVQGMRIGLDGSGNAYVVLTAWGSFDGQGSRSTDVGIFLMKFSSIGDWQWTVHQGSGPGTYVVANGLAVDDSGSSHIVGQTNGVLVGSRSGEHDMFIMKFAADGTWEWTQQPQHSGRPWKDRAVDVKLDASSNAFVVGHSDGSYYGDKTVDEVFIMKFDSSGHLLWKQHVGTADWHPMAQPSGIVLADANNPDSAYVVGGYRQGYSGPRVLMKFAASSPGDTRVTSSSVTITTTTTIRNASITTTTSGNCAMIGRCDWYIDCLRLRYEVCHESESYALLYGRVYCEKYTSVLSGFSEKGQRWVQAVRSCLQLVLMEYLREHPAATCDMITEAAFESHPVCYNSPSSLDSSLSWCSLSFFDKRVVLRTVFRGLASWQGAVQSATTVIECVKPWALTGWQALTAVLGQLTLKPDVVEDSFLQNWQGGHSLILEMKGCSLFEDPYANIESLADRMNPFVKDPTSLVSVVYDSEQMHNTVFNHKPPCLLEFHGTSKGEERRLRIAQSETENVDIAFTLWFGSVAAQLALSLTDNRIEQILSFVLSDVLNASAELLNISDLVVMALRNGTVTNTTASSTSSTSSTPFTASTSTATPLPETSSTLGSSTSSIVSSETASTLTSSTTLSVGGSATSAALGSSTTAEVDGPTTDVDVYSTTTREPKENVFSTMAQPTSTNAPQEDAAEDQGRDVSHELGGGFNDRPTTVAPSSSTIADPVTSTMSTAWGQGWNSTSTASTLTSATNPTAPSTTRTTVPTNVQTRSSSRTADSTYGATVGVTQLVLVVMVGMCA